MYILEGIVLNSFNLENMLETISHDLDTVRPRSLVIFYIVSII